MKFFKLISFLAITGFTFSSFAGTDGVLRVEGQPGVGQPKYAFVEKCATDDKGNLVKFSCGNNLSENHELQLNVSLKLSEGKYLLSYDQAGSAAFVTIHADENQTIRLEQVNFPNDIAPADIRVILDLTNEKQLDDYLLRLFAVNTIEQYNYERADAPKSDMNDTFYKNIDNIQKPDDLYNTVVRIDWLGFPEFWNVYHTDFGSGVQMGMWAQETGHFVSVLPGTYTILVYKGRWVSSLIRGIHSLPQN